MLVERDVALRRLRMALQRAGTEGSFHILRGPAAVGRTSLLREAARIASDAGLEVRAAAGRGPAWCVGDELGLDRRRLARQPPDGPLLLTVDDVQDADAGSLLLLAAVAATAPPGRVVLVCACRTPVPAEPEPALARLLAEPAAVVTDVGALTSRGVRALGGDDAVAHRSAGLPGFVAMLVGAGAGNGDGGVQSERTGPVDWVRARLAPLRTGARATAIALAITGADDIATLAASAAESPEEVLAALDDLRIAGLVTAHGPPRLTAPILVEAVLESVGKAAVATISRRAVAHLAEAGDDTAVAELLVRSPAVGDPATATRLLAAARTADVSTAVAWLRRALDEPPSPVDRPAVLLALGEAEQVIGDAASVDHLKAATRSARDPDLRRRAEGALRIGLHILGRSDEAAQWVHGRDRTPDIAAALDRAVRGRRRREAAALAYEASLVGAGTADAVVAAMRAARPGDLQPAHRRVWGLEYAGGLEEAGSAAAELLATSRDSSRYEQAFAETFAAMVELRVGRLRPAEQGFAAAHAKAERQGFDFLRIIAAAGRAEAMVLSGRAKDALAVLGPLPLDQPAVELTFDLPLYVRGLAQLAAGASAEGISDLLRAGALFVEQGIENPSYRPWRSHAAVALASVDRHRAEDLARADLDVARSWGEPTALGVALRAVALLRHGHDRVALLAEAAAVTTRSMAMVERARILVDLGAALRRARRPGDARRPLHDGLALARATGAAGIASEAELELAAAGGRVNRSGLVGVDALTAMERRVAVLARAGRSNQSIADELHLSRRTIEAHLRSVYTKLGINSRQALPVEL